MDVIPSYEEVEVSMETRIESPAHFLIKIESFSSLSKCGIRKYETKEFAAGDYKWKLIIYPEGHQSGESKVENDVGHISVYLTMAEIDSLPADWEVNAMFNVFLYNHNLDNYLCFRGRVCRFHIAKFEWGFSKLISKKSFMDLSNGYLVDDNCVFGAEVFVIKRQRVVECLSILKDPCPGKHVWKISNFSNLKDSCSSDEFTAGGFQWKVVLHPSGNGNGTGQSVSIFLHCVNLSRHSKVKVEFTICMKDQLNDNHVSMFDSLWFNSVISSWGWAKFVPIADMQDSSKGLVVNDCCIVEAEVSVKATA